MNAVLVGVDSRTKPIELQVPRLPAVVGRGPDADIHVDDHWISRRHCRLEELNGTLLVRDLGSKNGTRVNNHPVTEALLQPGDELSLGLCTFRARYEPESTQTAPPESARPAATSS